MHLKSKEKVGYENQSFDGQLGGENNPGYGLHNKGHNCISFLVNQFIIC